MSDPASIPPLTIAFGGVELNVAHLDGRCELVKVRLLPIALYPLFFSVLNTELRLAELLCSQPEGWADSLHPEALMDIVEKGTDLNFTPARRWAERRTKLEEASAPLAERMAGVAKAISASSALTAASLSADAAPPK